MKVCSENTGINPLVFTFGITRRAVVNFKPWRI